jgi:transposase-like protein
VNETWIGGKQAGLKGGRQLAGRKALLVAVAVERRLKPLRADGGAPSHRNYLGRLRLEVVPNSSCGATLGAFIARNVEPGSTIITDGLPRYKGLAETSYTHLSFSESAMRRAGAEPDAVPGAHRVASNLKTWLRGTHHGVGADHLDRYLDEFVFRFNRRFYPMAGSATLLGLGTAIGPTTTDEILSPLSPCGGRRKGRSTRLTSARFSVQINQAESLQAAMASINETLDDIGA